MPNKRISELSAAGALSGTELVEIVQGGANVQTTTQDIADLGGGGGGGGSFASITGDPYDNTALAADLRGKSDALLTVDSTHAGNYTLAAAEMTNINNGAALIVEGDDTGDLTVPANATVAFPVGTVIGLRGYDNVVEAVGVTVTPTSSTLEIPAGTTATLEKTGTDAWILHNGSAQSTITKYIQFAASDETTALTTGTGKTTFRMPHAMTLTGIRASLTTAQTSGSIVTVDVNEGGTTILSTKLTIDNTEKTSTTATTAAVISDSSLADDAEITVDIDQVGDGTAKGLKITLIGY
jgi:hypothetical protein